jgi:hypothetical protein
MRFAFCGRPSLALDAMSSIGSLISIKRDGGKFLIQINEEPDDFLQNKRTVLIILPSGW